jgi:hypothetical protein
VVLLNTETMQQQSPIAQLGAANILEVSSISQGRLANGLVYYCGLTTAQPMSRATSCATLTNKYLDNAVDFFSTTNVLTAAEQWSQKADRVKALRDERDAYHRLKQTDRSDIELMRGRPRFSCEQFEIEFQTIRNALTIGQIAYAKILLAERQKSAVEIIDLVRRAAEKNNKK